MEINDEVAKATSALIRMKQNGISPMEDDDYEKASIIAKELTEYSFYQDITPIEIEDAMILSKEYMKQYPNIEEELDFLEEIKIRPFIVQNDYEEMYYNTTINPKTFKIETLQIPLNTNRQSPIYIAHEIHHMLKDTNKEEYKTKLRYADVLPLFFELLVGEEKKEIITNRLYMLNTRKEIIEEHINRKDNNPFKELIDSNVSQYYLSFYYAILLLEEYHKNPKKVLEDISLILKHQSTTEKYLQENNLTNSNHKEFVKERMKSFK
ncbi:MAG: hypothetical protein IJG68_04840 [Bacilli bacterium]|nr:hypothetical protein [Bacilli bacterium]